MPQAQTKVEVILTRRFRIVVLSVVYMFYRYTGAHTQADTSSQAPGAGGASGIPTGGGSGKITLEAQLPI